MIRVKKTLDHVRPQLLGKATIEEERWEIQHHRAQERLELTEMYAAKGLSGKLLEEVSTENACGCPKLTVLILARVTSSLGPLVC